MPQSASHRAHRVPTETTNPSHVSRALPTEYRPERLERLGGLGEIALGDRMETLTIAERWSATDGATGTARLAYRLHERPTPRALVRLRSLPGANPAHLVPVESISIDETNHAWIVCPYLGDVSGVLSLEAALGRHGGTLPILETAQAVAHIRSAFASLRGLGLTHPNLTLDQIILCPHGKLHIELAGVASILDAPAAMDTFDQLADDRAAAQLAAHLLTGEPNANAQTLKSVFPRRKRAGVVAWSINHAI
ncbi:hypothetical protein JYT11_00155 [Planctomycetaceae bacterium AH-315-I19]|nr:hypothetical protein [Planctomycetaceae bacterium AH-315-I19]